MAGRVRGIPCILPAKGLIESSEKKWLSSRRVRREKRLAGVAVEFPELCLSPCEADFCQRE